MSNDQVFRLLGLFFLALALFNFPILNLFSETTARGGLPPLFTYIFVSWAAIIAGTAWIVEARKSNKQR